MEPLHPTPPPTDTDEKTRVLALLNALLKAYRSDADLMVTAFLIGRAVGGGVLPLPTEHTDEPEVLLPGGVRLSVNTLGVVAIRKPKKRFGHAFTPMDEEVQIEIETSKHVKPEEKEEE